MPNRFDSCSTISSCAASSPGFSSACALGEGEAVGVEAAAQRTGFETCVLGGVLLLALEEPKMPRRPDAVDEVWLGGGALAVEAA